MKLNDAMKMKLEIALKTSITISTFAFIFFSVAVANAYSLYPAASGAAPSTSGLQSTAAAPNYGSFNFGQMLNQLVVPFENFVKSVGVAGSTVEAGNPAAPSFEAPTMPTTPQALSAAGQNAFQQFDAWLYSIAGFHITAVIAFILNGISWVLGIAKEIVDGLLSLLNNK